MPYLRISSLPLDHDTKRRLAEELTAVSLRIIPDQEPEWTTVHFTPYMPGDLAIGGRMVTDRSFADTHIEVATPPIDDETWAALRRELTDALAKVLDTPDHGRWHLNVQLHPYHARHSTASEQPLDETEADAGAGETSDEGAETRKRRGGPPWLLLGFAAGAIFAYRWLSGRIATGTTVDAAPPLFDKHGEAVDAGDLDPRRSAAAAAPSDTGS